MANFAYASAIHERCGGVVILLTINKEQPASEQLKMCHDIVAYLEGNPALSIVVAYAPTEGADLEDKSEFYGNFNGCSGKHLNPQLHDTNRRF